MGGCSEMGGGDSGDAATSAKAAARAAAARAIRLLSSGLRVSKANSSVRGIAVLMSVSPAEAAWGVRQGERVLLLGALSSCGCTDESAGEKEPSIGFGGSGVQEGSKMGLGMCAAALNRCATTGVRSVEFETTKSF